MSATVPAASAMAGAAAPAAITPARLAQIRKTAQQFEAIFVRQMLDAAGKTHFDPDEADDQGMSSFRDLANARFADLAAQKGSFGIAGLVEKQLMAREQHGATPPAAPGGPAGR